MTEFEAAVLKLLPTATGDSVSVFELAQKHYGTMQPNGGQRAAIGRACRKLYGLGKAGSWYDERFHRHKWWRRKDG